MKPGKFEYFDPTTIDEALSLLAQYGDDAKVLAGGQSLVPLMNMRLAKPSVLIDVNRLPGLDYVDSRNGGVAIGALTRHRSIEKSALLKEVCPMLPAAAEHVADLQVRNRGTFGGSIAHADPAAEFCAVVLALGGQIVASGREGQRTIAADDFFLGPLMTSLEPTELLTQVSLPALGNRAWSIRSVAPRHGDLAIAGVTVVLDFDAQGVCSEARIGMYGLGPTPLRARAAEAMVAGNRLDDRLMAQVADQAVQEAEPFSDVRASASYRKELAKRLVVWNLRNASGKLASGGDR